MQHRYFARNNFLIQGNRYVHNINILSWIIYYSVVLAKLDNFTHNQAIFLAMHFIAFGFNLLSDLNSNVNNFIKIVSDFFNWLFSQLIRRLLDVPKNMIDSFYSIKVFFKRINSDESTAKFLFYWFLSSIDFIVSISVAITTFINFCCKFRVI